MSPSENVEFVDGSPDSSLGYKPLNLGYISNIKVSTHVAPSPRKRTTFGGGGINGLLRGMISQRKDPNALFTIQFMCGEENSCSLAHACCPELWGEEKRRRRRKRGIVWNLQKYLKKNLSSFPEANGFQVPCICRCVLEGVSVGEGGMDGKGVELFNDSRKYIRTLPPPQPPKMNASSEDIADGSPSHSQ